MAKAQYPSSCKCNSTDNYSCGANKRIALTPPAYVSAIGKISWRFPNDGVEREFLQVRSRVDTSGKTDSEVAHMIFSYHGNRYPVRELCWILSVGGMPTYVLMPRDPADFDLLIEAARPNPARRFRHCDWTSGAALGAAIYDTPEP